MSAPITIHRDGPICWITLNRPEKLNALNREMLDQLSAALDEERHSDSRVIVLSGAGRSFCAGHDLDSSSPEVTQPGDSVDDWNRQAGYVDTFFKIFDHPKPVIAAIHGYCIAGGTHLAAFADILIVADNAKLAASPLLPLGGGFISPVVAYRIGVGRAKLLSFSAGHLVSGRQATDWGWAVESVAAESLLDRAREMALDIARTAPSVLQMKKRSLNRVLELQGFRLAAYTGADIDVVVHETDAVTTIKGLVATEGFKEVRRRFDAGELSL